jgi:hypothetical protein
MNRRLLLFITLPLLLMTIAFIVLHQSAARTRADEDQATAASHNYSGNQFLLEGQPVEVELDGALDRVQLGDSLAPTLSLRAISIDDASRLGNEHGGMLVPTLTLSGCTVHSEQAGPKDTQQPIGAFVWHWGVLCNSAGQQDLEVMLAFQSASGAPNDSDPVPYRYSQRVNVTRPWSLEQVSAGLGALSTLLTVITGAVGLFGKRQKAPT